MPMAGEWQPVRGVVPAEGDWVELPVRTGGYEEFLVERVINDRVYLRMSNGKRTWIELERMWKTARGLRRPAECPRCGRLASCRCAEARFGSRPSQSAARQLAEEQMQRARLVGTTVLNVGDYVEVDRLGPGTERGVDVLQVVGKDERTRNVYLLRQNGERLEVDEDLLLSQARAVGRGMAAPPEPRRTMDVAVRNGETVVMYSDGTYAVQDDRGVRGPRLPMAGAMVDGALDVVSMDDDGITFVQDGGRQARVDYNRAARKPKVQVQPALGKRRYDFNAE